MKHKWVQIDGELVPVGQDYRPELRQPHWQVMPDAQPHRNMVTGEIVNSRSRHREILRDYGCFEIGNDSSLHRDPRPNMESPPGLKDALIRAANECLKPDRR